jgi:tetratricopeptide (TPR) repeat protein
MLGLYAQDVAMAEIFERLYGVELEQFDRAFLEWVWEKRLQRLVVTPALDDDRVASLSSAVAAGRASHRDKILLGWAFVARNNPVDAGRMVREALREKPDSGEALLLHAELMRQRGALDEAAATYARAFEQGGDDFDSRIRFGRLLEDRGELEAAVEQYQRAKRCWPQCTDQQSAPQLQLARVLRKLERVDEAAAELAAFCGLTGRAFAPRLELAAHFTGRGDHASAVRYLEEANQIDPFMATLHVRLGDAYVETNQREAAIREYRVSLAVPPKLDRAYMESKEGPPSADDPVVRAARARVMLKLARLHRELQHRDEAARWLDLAKETARDTDAVDDVEAEAARYR